MPITPLFSLLRLERLHMTSDNPRRMRSAAVSLGLVGALAFSLSGCGTGGQRDTRRCVDTTTEVVVEDGRCESTATSGGGGGYAGPHRWYYGGRVSGGKVSGGSYDAPSGIQRGGFGGGKGGSGGKGGGG